MRGGVGFALGLIVGAAGGAVTAYFVMKKKFMDIAQKEIDDFRNSFFEIERKENEENEDPEKDSAEGEEPVPESETETPDYKEEYRKIANDYSYKGSNFTNYNAVKKKSQVDVLTESQNHITRSTIEEFEGEIGVSDGYKREYMTYYHNGILYSESFEESVDGETAMELIGEEFLDYLDKTTDSGFKDSIFIKNKYKKLMIQIDYSEEDYED